MKEMKITLNIDIPELNEKWWDRYGSKKEIGEIKQKACSFLKDKKLCCFEIKDDCEGCPFYAFLEDYEYAMMETISQTLIEDLSSIISITKEKDE